MGCRAKSTVFILAASGHLSDLAKEPPQDFWTRISSQVRVDHPLRFVSETDAEKFLEAFFWYSWWKTAKKWLGTQKENKSELVPWVLGRRLACVQEEGEEKENDLLLPQAVLKALVQTVAPIAVRDQIPIRGLRTMIEQIFNKVIWSTRYGMVPSRHIDKNFEYNIGRVVNHAVQDIMAILNAARSTPHRPPDDSGMDAVAQAITNVGHKSAGTQGLINTFGLGRFLNH